MIVNKSERGEGIREAVRREVRKRSTLFQKKSIPETK